MNREKLRKFYHKVNKKIKNNRFLVQLNIWIVPAAKYFYFKNERLLAKGKSISQSDKKSILYFTAHKCASTFMSETIEKLSASSQMVPIRFSNYFPNADEDKIFEDKKFLERAFKSKGYYYGAFRKFHKIPNLDDYFILLIVRDPRDILTSLYFSTAFNHPISVPINIKNRKKALTQTIDEYVLEHAPRLDFELQEYINILLPKPNVIFLKYEDMITKFADWLPQLAKNIGMGEDVDLINQIISKAKFSVEKEDKNSFVRNIKAGDHLEKLKPETRKQLDAIFADTLKKFNYVN